MNTLAAAGHGFLSWVSDDYAKMRSTAVKNFPNKGRFLIDFETAFLVAFGYIAIVAYGLIKRASSKTGASVAPAKASSSSNPASVSKRVEPKGALHYCKCLYNLVQVALCGWLMFHAARIHLQTYGSSEGTTPLICLPFQFDKASPVSVSFMNPDLAYIVWVFYLSKVLDFFDTIFIIAGSSWAQFSFLHYYHHLTIYLVYWMNANVGADGDIYLTVVLNCFVHCVMYWYYFVTATDFLNLKALFNRNKLLVTAVQMLQFVCMIFQGVYILLYPASCPFPRRVTLIYVPYIITLFILFANFALKTLFQSGKKAAAASKKQ